MPLNVHRLKLVSDQMLHFGFFAFVFVCFFTLLFTIVLFQWDISQGKFGLPSPWKASCDRVALPNLGYMLVGFSVSIIHRTLTWTTGYLTCVQMLMHAIVHGGCTDTVRESAQKVDSGRKIPCLTRESNLRRRSDVLPTELHLHPFIVGLHMPPTGAT